MPKAKTEEQNKIYIGTDFESRNWLLLVRLTEIGYSKEEAKKIEEGKVSLKDILKLKKTT